MKKSRSLATLVVFTGLAAGLLGLNLGLGNTPVLGLDLKGGLSVIYSTAEPASPDDLIIVRDLMRTQLEGFGIAEPDVRVEGEHIIVDLPGVSDQAAAFEALNVSGIVTLRAVLQCDALGDDNAGFTQVTAPPTGATTVPESSTGDSSSSSASQGSSGSLLQPVAFGRPAVATTTPPTTDAATPSPTSDAATSTLPMLTSAAPTTSPTLTALEGSTTDSTTPVSGTETTAAPFLSDGQSLLTTKDGSQICLVGPSGGTGEVFVQGSAQATINPGNGQWIVGVDLRSDGEAAWNALARQCFPASATCPSGQLAIVLDDVIQSAPVVQSSEFSGTVQISGAFTEPEVRALARVLNRGAFPVPVVQERVETVSATAGGDSLNAAVIAGLIGVGFLLMFMVWYYRKLSVVIVAGLLVWGMAVFSLASFVSQATNYALTLAGVTGMIVAVGVTVDTYVVFFERLRDEMRRGRSLRNAAPRSFKATWRTILAADLVSLVASVILFLLSVGSVKGFALYLGLTTVCDLLVFYFFSRPAVYLLSMTRWFNREQSGVGIGAAS